MSVFVIILGKEWVRSHQGDTSTPPAGAGRPESRMTWRSASDNPPPAESPAITMCSGLTGRCAAPSGGLIKNISRYVFNFTFDSVKTSLTGSEEVLNSTRKWVLRGETVVHSCKGVTG